jgi:Nif11 domain
MRAETMSQESFVRFLLAVRRSVAMKARYDGQNLSEVLFHARNEGYSFTAEDTTLVGALEANVILAKDGDAYDGSSRLWREMWGRRHLEYLVDHVVARYTDQELEALIAKSGSAAG